MQDYWSKCKKMLNYHFYPDGGKLFGVKKSMQMQLKTIYCKRYEMEFNHNLIEVDMQKNSNIW